MSTRTDTIREILEGIQSSPSTSDAMAATEAIRILDESESAWRSDGTTYRLVEDQIEVPE